MVAPRRWVKYWPYPAGALGLAALGCVLGQQLGSRQLNAAVPARSRQLPADPALDVPGGAAYAASARGAAEGVILAQKKRIMGRLRSLEMVRRVATTIRPILDRTIEMPGVQGELQALAAASGVSLAEYKTYFKGKQEADLLLESGGDPNARSVADAIGVAQFMVGTGQRCGLRINLGASNALSREISQVEAQIAWLEAQPPSWSRAVPPDLKGVLPPAPAEAADASQDPVAATAGEEMASRDQWLAYRRLQWDRLVARRRKVDERFDPARAIAAQTRYLIRLTRRYGGVDWALQAYHGGEAGVARTVRLYSTGGGGATLASRGGGSRWVTYADFYQGCTPTATPEAFNYLFGRSDDHRYYWWKVLMAERALDLYRKDPQEFERQWQLLKPGCNAEAAWYPEPENLQFEGPSALRAAYLDGTLVPLPREAGALGLRTENLAALDPESAGLHKGLRPEAMGALLRVVHIYRSCGGGEPVTVLSLVQSNQYRQKWEARYPPKPLPPNVPRDPQFHTTGLVFDLKRPARDWDRKVLEYALGRMYDTLRISWRPETDGGSRRYHVAVAPEFKAEMAGYYYQARR